MLTPDEKQAGRLFRDSCQKILDNLNAERPPYVAVLPLWRVVRHECPAEDGSSVGIVLREVVTLSPEYWMCRCGRVSTWGPPFSHSVQCDGSSRIMAAGGRFAWIQKEGRCSGCGRTARTGQGRFVVVSDQQADYGRPDHGRRQASAHPGDT